MKRFLRPCLEAYLAQTVAPREFLVVDDGSSDGSQEFLRAFVCEHPQIRLIELPRNVGVEGVFKTALAASTSAYLYSGAMDDFARPQLIERLSEAVRLYPQAAVVTVNYRQWYDQDGLLPNQAPEPRYLDSGIRLATQPTYFEPASMVELVRNCRVPAFGMPLYKRDFLLRSSLPDRALGHYADLMFNLTAGFEAGLVHLPEVLVDFRLHFQSYGSARRRSFRHEVDTLKRVLNAVNARELRHVRQLFLSSGFFGLMGWRSILAALSSPTRWNLLIGHLNRRLLTVATPNDLRLAASTVLGWLKGES